MRNWYLLVTKPREEERAKQHLENQGYKVFRPLIRQYRIRKGRQVAITEPLFPRYIFIHLDDMLGNWSRLRSTRGVAKLVKFSDSPAIVPGAVINLLKKQCIHDDVLDVTDDIPYVFEAGDSVEITKGSFKGLQAIISEQKGEDRVILLLNLLGQEQALELSISQIKSTT